MNIKLYRKRFIPDEIVDISSDEVLYMDSELIITKWLPINKRDDIGSGVSYAFLKEGYKISKFYDLYGQFLYWYCDIIDYRYNAKTNSHVLVDLLVDVKVMENGEYEILDMEELNEAYNKNLITAEEMTIALERLNKLLKLIGEGEFPMDVCKRDF